METMEQEATPEENKGQIAKLSVRAYALHRLLWLLQSSGDKFVDKKKSELNQEFPVTLIELRRLGAKVSGFPSFLVKEPPRIAIKLQCGKLEEIENEFEDLSAEKLFPDFDIEPPLDKPI